MTNQEMALAISAICFGLVIGFLTGYAVRAYISYRHRRSNYGGWASSASEACVAAEPRSRSLRHPASVIWQRLAYGIARSLRRALFLGAARRPAAPPLEPHQPSQPRCQQRERAGFRHGRRHDRQGAE